MHGKLSRVHDDVPARDDIDREQRLLAPDQEFGFVSAALEKCVAPEHAGAGEKAEDCLAR